jgi:hypothetical protein
MKRFLDLGRVTTTVIPLKTNQVSPSDLPFFYHYRMENESKWSVVGGQWSVVGGQLKAKTTRRLFLTDH